MGANFELTSSVESSSSSSSLSFTSSLAMHHYQCQYQSSKLCARKSVALCIIFFYTVLIYQYIWICIGKNKEYATHKYTKSFHSFASRNVLEMLCVAWIFCDVVRLVCKMQRKEKKKSKRRESCNKLHGAREMCVGVVDYVDASLANIAQTIKQVNSACFMLTSAN